MLPPWVSSWCYQRMLDLTGKYLPGTNTLAYLASSSATEKKSFITFTPVVKVDKRFSSLLITRLNKFQLLSPAILSSLV